jgi:hypothetical protein
MSHQKKGNKLMAKLKSRHALFSFFKKVSVASWSGIETTNKRTDQLTQNECEALWVRINQTLHSFN